MKGISRRDFLAMTAAGAAAAHRGLAYHAPFRFMAVGQALVVRDIATQHPPGYDEMRERLARADVAFTNLEVAIRGPLARGAKSLGAGVEAEPEILDSLRSLSFDLLSLSNNHAGDLGEAGILSAIEETTKRGFTVAGTGRTIEEASRPGYLKTPRGTVALVAMASNAIRPDSMATSRQAGVNHLAQRSNVVDSTDADRVLGAIRTAASQADWVVVYQHDHYWAPDWQQTPDWKQAWCRRCLPCQSRC